MLLQWKAALCYSSKMLLSLCPNTYRIVLRPSQWEHLFPNTHRDQRGWLEQDLRACVCTMHCCSHSLWTHGACRFVDNPSSLYSTVSHMSVLTSCQMGCSLVWKTSKKIQVQTSMSWALWETPQPRQRVSLPTNQWLLISIIKQWLKLVSLLWHTEEETVLNKSRLLG